MSRTAATLIGFAAVLLWALLALLTVATAPVPPFQLTAMAFAIGGLAGMLLYRARGVRPAGVARALTPRLWLLGVGGLFGYHFLYFSALRLAPPAEAGLIAYLWPLLIVVFSGLLPGERLRPGHLAGALLAFGGAALLVAPALGSGGGGHVLAGYALAGLCALTWSGYSLLSRLAGAVPTAAVALFCLASAGLGLLAHLALEQTVWPQGAGGWLAVVLLGLGPVGGAFYLWDVGVKRGDIQLLGVASYAAPLLSTLLLVLAGHAQPDWRLAVAALAIVGGGWLAARVSRRERAPRAG